jgi:nuclear transport factor 2 (NTF2) superfamily protein
MTTRPPVPPFTLESATQKVRLAEDSWNSRDPERVSQGYALDSRWRNRSEFVTGRQDIVSFLIRKWTRELGYRLIKEWHDDSGNWYRSYGNENWEYNDDGLMRMRFACINDLPIKEADRKYHWPLGPRPDEHPSLSDLGF